MKNTMKKGFTLIELLVVITIIGILATGATSVYTSQIQKARDTTRINDVKALQSAVEQVYQDSSEYPHADSFASGTTDITGVKTYLDKFPSDPKKSQQCNQSSSCDYLYITGADQNTIEYGKYELSTAFENSANVTKKAGTDNGNDPKRYEIGLEIGSSNTNSDGKLDSAAPCKTTAGANPSSGTDLIVIRNGC